MSGVTGSPFRRLIKALNPGAVGLVVSEFVSAEAMTRGVERTLQMMRFRPEERPVAIQIFGYNIERMRDAALLVQESGADIVDINCGCPAPKIVRKGGGAELMRQPLHLAAMLKAVRQAVAIPVTVKIRSGYDASSINAVQIAKLAEEQGVDAISIHARTRAQMYGGNVDWELTRQVARAVSIPVFGSGDIVDRPSAEAAMGGSGAKASVLAGLYIGRGALQNPLLFSEIAEGREAGLSCNEGLVLSILARYVGLLVEEDLPPKAAVGRMKQLAARVGRGYPWRKLFCNAKSFAEQRRILEELHSDPQKWRQNHA